MAYDNVMSRTDVQPLIPEQVVNELLVNLANESAALRLFRRTQMSTNITRMPVLAALPTAYFVNGDTGQKQTTEVNWDNKYLQAEEIAVIVPIPDAVADDLQFDIWTTVRPLLEQAVGRVLDAAIFFGTNKPASWPTAIVPAAVAASQVVERGTHTAAEGGIAEDINDLLSFVEAGGFDPNGFVANRTFRSHMRGARSTDGQRLLDINGNIDSVEGLPVSYAMAGQWPTGTDAAELITGDFNQGILAVRQDFTWKLLTEAIIQDNTGAIIYNLAQQDMTALRLVFRVAFQVANTINYHQAVEADRYPWAVMRSPGA